MQYTINSFFQLFGKHVENQLAVLWLKTLQIPLRSSC